MGLLLEKIEEIDGLLKTRDNEYPAKGSVWRELDRECENFFNLLLKEPHFDQTPDESTVGEIQKFIKLPVFICGPGRSGTTLLAQLLDGHPDLFVLPGDSNYMDRFHNKKWKYNSLALYWIKRLINPLGQKPFWYLGRNPANYKRFLSYLSYFLEQKMEPFLAVVSSVYAANDKRTNSAKYWVEKNPGNEEHVETIISYFPLAKFIHIIRDPLENLVSQKKFSSLREQDFDAIEAALRIKSMINLGWTNLNKLGEKHYFIIRYEDLVDRLSKALNMICRFLDLNFSKSLYMPTVNNTPASSNSVEKERRRIGKVIKEKRMPRWIKYFTEEEKKHIISILYDTALGSGYSEWEKDEIRRYREIDYKRPKKFLTLNKFKNISRKIKKALS